MLYFQPPVHITAEDDVFIITSENYQRELNQGDWFVMFYAPWCGHCKKLKPKWSEIGAEYNRINLRSNVAIGKVDCTQTKDACAEYNIKGYPTLLFIRKGAILAEYKGDRDYEGMRDFVEAHPPKSTGKENEKIPIPKLNTGEEDVTVLTTETFDNAINTGGVTFVKFFAPWCGHCKKLAPVWQELGNYYTDDESVTIATVDCTDHESVCQGQQISGYPTLKLYSNGKMMAPFTGPRGLDYLKSFVDKQKSKIHIEL